MDATISFTVNGKQRTVVTDPDRPLLDVLREDLHLTGARETCGQGLCGCCTVVVNGRAVSGCLYLASFVDGAEVTTVESLDTAQKLSPVQEAFIEASAFQCGYCTPGFIMMVTQLLDEHAFQCGYCTPGMIMSAIALLEETPKPDDAQIREGMNGNLCRCCGYAKILSAVKAAVAAGVGGRQP
jgi:carbon-monoxide dehydrogenase small subunit